MARSLPLKIGSSYSGSTVIASAPSHAGHGCWMVACDVCSTQRVERGTRLRNGTARCLCASTPRKKPAHNLFSLATRVDELSDLVVRQGAEIALLKRLTQTQVFSAAKLAADEIVGSALAIPAGVLAPSKKLTWDEALAEVQQLNEVKVEPERIRVLLRRMTDLIDFADPAQQADMLEAKMALFREFSTWADKG